MGAIERVADLAAADGQSGTVVLTPGVDEQTVAEAIAARVVARGERVLILARTSRSAAGMATAIPGAVAVRSLAELERDGPNGGTPWNTLDTVCVSASVLAAAFKSFEEGSGGLSPQRLGTRAVVVVEGSQSVPESPTGDPLRVLATAAPIGAELGGGTRFLGVASVPQKMDGRPLHAAFGAVEIARITRAEAVSDGLVVPTRCLVPSPEVVEAITSDTQGTSLAQGRRAEAAVVGHWTDQATQGSTALPTILHAGSVAQAESLAAAFTEGGWRAETITSQTPTQRRRDILTGFAAGDIPVLAIHHAELTEPEARAAQCTLLARAGMGASHFLRSMASGSSACDGKDGHLVIDLVDNSSRWRASALATETDISPFAAEEIERLPPPAPARTPRQGASTPRTPRAGPTPAQALAGAFTLDGEGGAQMVSAAKEGERRVVPLSRVGEGTWMATSPSGAFALLTWADGHPFVARGLIHQKADGTSQIVAGRLWKAPDLKSAVLALTRAVPHEEAAAIDRAIAQPASVPQRAALKVAAAAQRLPVGGLAAGSQHAAAALATALAVSEDFTLRFDAALAKFGCKRRAPLFGRHADSVLGAAETAVLSANARTAATPRQVQAALDAWEPILALQITPAAVGAAQAPLRAAPLATLQGMHQATRISATIAEAADGDACDRLELGRRALAAELLRRGAISPDIARRLIRPLRSEEGVRLDERLLSGRGAGGRGGTDQEAR